MTYYARWSWKKGSVSEHKHNFRKWESNNSRIWTSWPWTLPYPPNPPLPTNLLLLLLSWKLPCSFTCEFQEANLYFKRRYLNLDYITNVFKIIKISHACSRKTRYLHPKFTMLKIWRFLNPVDEEKSLQKNLFFHDFST